MEINLDDLSSIIYAATGIRYRLVPLQVKCTYPVFRGEADDGQAAFVKVGEYDEWRRTAEVLKMVGDGGCFSRMLSSSPIDYCGHAVFVMEWKQVVTIRPEDMTDAQIRNFVAGCGELSRRLQQVCDFRPVKGSVNDPERLHSVLDGYVRRHPFAGLMLMALTGMPAETRTFGSRALSVIHGDFHAKNYGFAGDELTAVFDFDQITQGLACSDLANALVERFSCLGLSAAARRRLIVVTGKILSAMPWSRDDFEIAVNLLRLRFAVRRMEKHPGSAWVALDVLRRDRKIRRILDC